MTFQSPHAVRLSGLGLLVLVAIQLRGQLAVAEQQPVAVFAVAGVDRLLEDLDYLYDAAQTPQHAERIHKFVNQFNELRGLDRQRPIGVYLYLPSAGEQEPQPLLFVPVADVEALRETVQVGDSLRLERGDSENHLILHTDDGPLPVRLEHGFAFVDPTKSGTRLKTRQPDPATLLGDSLSRDDAVLLIRRAGVPPALFEMAIGQLRSDALKDQPQRAGESDTDYVIRRGFEERLLALIETAVRDWREARVAVRLSREERAVCIDTHVQWKAEGGTTQFLQQLRGSQSLFALQLMEPAPLSLSINWQPTRSGRDLLATTVQTLREQVDREVTEADEASRQAVTAILDALEASVAEQPFDSYIQIVGGPSQQFFLLGATAISESANVAGAMERLLPFAVDSDDIREIDMNVHQAAEVSIHRLWPQRLRKLDRRLYGEDAAIYLASGRGALWMAVGGEQTVALLTKAILAATESRSDDASLAPSVESGTPGTAGPPLLELSLHAGVWTRFARIGREGRKARLVELAKQAFDSSDEDRFQLKLFATSSGLRSQVRVEHGFVRWLGLALAARLEQP